MARPGFGVEIEGLNGAIRALKSLDVETADLKGVFGPIATEGRDVMAGFVRSRSGRLVRSLKGSRATNKAIVRGGGARVPHAGAVQWGWGRGNSEFNTGRFATGIKGSFEGQHFFEKTDAVMEPRSERLIVEGIEDLIRKYDL
jgi:hypothetical protein